MRLAVRHVETFVFETPVTGTIQVGRLTPRDHAGHYVCDWIVEVDADCQTAQHTDAYGNIVTTFSISGPLESLTLRAYGEVETEPSYGIIRGTHDKVPQGVFLRSDDSEGLSQIAHLTTSLMSRPGHEPIAKLHEVKDLLHAAKHLVDGTQTQTADGASQSQSMTNENGKGGDAGDAEVSDEAAQRLAMALIQHQQTKDAQLAVAFCETARLIGHPARLVSGYRLSDDSSEKKTNRDVWSEAHVEDLGWIGFDLDSGTCPSEEAIRVAVGLDEPSVAPLRFSHYGGGLDNEHQTFINVTRVTT